MLTLQEQSQQLRRQRYVRTSLQPSHLRPLLAVQSQVTNLLIRTGVNSRLVTFSWFVVSLVAYAFVAWGSPWSFVVGALLLYAKIILDICDGEVGRYQSRAMSEAENLSTHMQGIYLDRILHSVESPLLGLALGWGAFRLTGSLWFVACGIGISVFLGFCRVDGLLRGLVVWQFHERWGLATKVQRPSEGSDRTEPADRLSFRVFQKLVLCIRNGKRFTHVLLLCGAADWIFSTTLGLVIALPALVVSAAALGIADTVTRILRIQFSDTLARSLPADFGDRDFQ